MRPRPLSFYLFALCAALTIPILIVTAFMTWQFARSEQLRLKADVEDSGKQIEFAIERQLANDLEMLRALASSPALRYRDFEAFTEQVKSLSGRDDKDTSIVIRDIDSGSVLVSVGQPSFDAKELNGIDPWHTISNFVGAATFEDSAYYVSVPVTIDGTLQYWLHGRMSLARLVYLVNSLRLGSGYFSSIVDRNGIILARSSEPEKHYGRKLPGLDGPDRNHFTWSGVNPQGVKVYGVFRRLPSGWGVTGGISENLLNAPLYRSLAWLGVLAFVMVAISALIAWTLTRVMADAASSLTQKAGKLGDGLDLGEPVTAVAEANTVGSAMVAASRKLRQQAEALAAAKEELERHVEERTAELAEKRHLLETTLASMDQGLIVIDPTGRIQLHNSRAAEMIGLENDLLNTHPNVRDTVRLQADRGDFSAMPDDVKIIFDRSKLQPGTTLVHERELPAGGVLEVRYRPAGRWLAGSHLH